MVKKEQYIGLGLDTDTAPDKRKTDTYWDAENIYIMNNGRSLSIKPIKGETKIFDFANLHSVQASINGYCVFMEVIYVFTTTSEGRNSILKIVEGATAFTELAYGTWNIAANYRVDAVANYETDSIIKLYWVDGYNPLRYINVASTTGQYTRGIDVVDQVALSPIELTIESGGNLIAGSIQYAYNFYYTNGSQSNLSPTSDLISITDYYKGYNSQENTGLKVKLEFTGLDTDYDSIKIYSIHYQELNQTPKVSLIYDAALQGVSTLTIYDDGNLQIAELSLAEILAIQYSSIVPNTLAIKRDRLFVANYTATNFNPTIDTRAYSYPSGTGPGTYLQQSGGSSVLYSKAQLDSLDPLHDCINPSYSLYAYQYNSTTLGGTGKYIQYTYHTTTVVNNVIPPKSLKQREIYRIGITLINKYGQKSPVKWVADIKIPNQGVLGLSSPTIYGLSIGLSVTLLNTADLTAAGVVSYQMCIVERKSEDRTILGQGFIVPSCKYTTFLGVPLTPYYHPNYIAKDIIPSVISGTAFGALTSDQKHNAGGDISKDYTNFVDFEDYSINSATFNNLVELHNETVFFYSSDTIFDEVGIMPDKLRILGTASSTLSDSGMIVPSVYGSNAVQAKQPMTPYSTEWETFTSLANWFGGPGHVFDESKKTTTDPSIPFFEIVMNKRYTTTNFKTTPIDVNINSAEFLKAGESKVLDSTTSVSNSCYINGLINILANDLNITYNTKFCSSIALKFTSANWHDSGNTYPYSDFDEGNIHGAITGRAIPLVELVRTVTNQYGGNTYEDRQRNEYLLNGKVRLVSESSLAYIGDITIAKLSVNRSDGQDAKEMGTQNIYEYINLPYIENNHNVLARSDNMHNWSIELTRETNYNHYRIDDNHKLLGAYNQKPTLFKGYAMPYNFKDIDKYPLSILGSNAKNPNETLDSWLVFNPSNSKLLEGQYGTITKLHNLNGELLAIQSTGIAVIAVEPRIQTQGSDGFQVSLGIGSLFYDHRYLTTVTGSSNKFTVTDDGKNLYYYDSINNTINTLQEGKLSTLHTIKGILDYQLTLNSLPHTVTFANKLDQVYFQFNEFTLVYDLLLQKFISKHTLLNSNKWIIPNKGKIYQINDILGTDFKTTLYTQYTGTVKNSKIIYLMCPDPTYEKVFHNLEYRLKDNDFTTIKVNNDRGTSDTVSIDVQNKFDIHRVHLPRVQNSRERWRGIYIFVELNNTLDFSLDDMVLMYNIKG
jgi:hypothetical protein